MCEFKEIGIDNVSEEKARYSPPRQAQDRREWEAVLNLTWPWLCPATVTVTAPWCRCWGRAAASPPATAWSCTAPGGRSARGSPRTSGAEDVYYFLHWPQGTPIYFWLLSCVLQCFLSILFCRTHLQSRDVVTGKSKLSCTAEPYHAGRNYRLFSITV